MDPHDVIDRYSGIRPVSWGTRLPGVLGRAPVRTVVTSGRTRPVGCLTFDACANPQGGAASNGFDAELVEYLRDRRIPATLFLSYRWASTHPHLTATLADDPLFEIGNHGTAHRPVTVNGRSAYGIAGRDRRRAAWHGLRRDRPRHMNRRAAGRRRACAPPSRGCRPTGGPSGACRPCCATDGRVPWGA